MGRFVLAPSSAALPAAVNWSRLQPQQVSCRAHCAAADACVGKGTDFRRREPATAPQSRAQAACVRGRQRRRRPTAEMIDLGGSLVRAASRASAAPCRCSRSGKRPTFWTMQRARRRANIAPRRPSDAPRRSVPRAAVAARSSQIATAMSLQAATLLQTRTRSCSGADLAKLVCDAERARYQPRSPCRVAHAVLRHHAASSRRMMHHRAAALRPH